MARGVRRHTGVHGGLVLQRGGVGRTGTGVQGRREVRGTTGRGVQGLARRRGEVFRTAGSWQHLMVWSI